MIRFLTAGESHGKALVTIVEGLPSNLPVDIKYLNYHLSRRRAGYGRGIRMKIESDTAEIISGVRNGKTIGSPIAIRIENNDWKNWLEVMNTGTGNIADKITIPRPGHADLVGVQKFNFDDIRNSIERSSARETAARTAAGTLARILLESFNISIGSYVESIGGIYSKKNFLNSLLNNRIPADFKGWSLSESADQSEVRIIDSDQENRVISKIKTAKKNGDTLGGTFTVVATGVPAGLGSFMHYDKKLDAALTASIMSINAVKAAEIGMGFKSADITGSMNNDEIIFKDDQLTRKTNYAGGIEGGISTGLPVIARGAMKPISTLMNPVKTVDLKKLKTVTARRERSDFTAVPACAVIAEAMTAWTIAEFFTEKFGGDSLEEMRDNFNSYTTKMIKRIRKNFK
jgi:chorismate synthase